MIPGVSWGVLTPSGSNSSPWRIKSFLHPVNFSMLMAHGRTKVGMAVSVMPRMKPMSRGRFLAACFSVPHA